jgi:predicted DNA-binding transcriptional regulator YafY
MSRMERLLELMIVLQHRSRFTAQQLADEMGVSRRTMLRDLRALEVMGVPLFATPGAHGGYEVIAHRRLLSLAFSVEEACGVLLSYESFLQYAQSPFAAQSLSAVTKLRNALPADVVHLLDRVRRHVAVLDRRPHYDAPHLEAVLEAALVPVHLRITYDGKQGVGERVIFPFGVYAQNGFWYCACYDERRQQNLTLRADRVLSVERVEGLPHPEHIEVANWIATVERDDGHGLPVRARVSPRGLRNADFEALWGRLPVDEHGWGVLDTAIPASEVEYYATRLLPLGADVVVLSPPELIAVLRAKASAIMGLYAEAAG